MENYGATAAQTFFPFFVTLVSPTPLAIYDASATLPYLAYTNASFWTFFCKF